MKKALIDIANQKCIKYESIILKNYSLDYEKLEKTPENIDEIERIIQLINTTRDSGSGHVQFNEENIKIIKGYTELMDDFRFERTDEQLIRHRDAILSALKFERWLENRISTLMTFSNNF